MVYRFIYREILKRDVEADSLTEALRILSDSTDTVFGIHPLDYDCFYIL